eukprot:231540-Amorphochlora_amoeboformis.AAC.1
MRDSSDFLQAEPNPTRGSVAGTSQEACVHVGAPQIGAEPKARVLAATTKVKPRVPRPGAESETPEALSERK